MNALNLVGDERDKKRSKHVETWTFLSLVSKYSGWIFSHASTIAKNEQS
jgi:hypothetical protein